MANTRELLQTVSERVLSNWTALKLAVEHGMGNRDSAQEFSNYLTEVLCMNDRLDSDDVAAEIEEYMDEVFHTELQDDSSADVARELLRFHQYCVQGSEALAIAELDKLPAAQPWIVARKTIVETRNEITEVQEKEASSAQVEDDEMEDDGWTAVKSKRGQK